MSILQLAVSPCKQPILTVVGLQEYVTEASRVVMEQTGLLPHVNAGVLARGDFQALKAVSGAHSFQRNTMLQGGCFQSPVNDRWPRRGAYL